MTSNYQIYPERMETEDDDESADDSVASRVLPSRVERTGNSPSVPANNGGRTGRDVARTLDIFFQRDRSSPGLAHKEIDQQRQNQSKKQVKQLQTGQTSRKEHKWDNPKSGSGSGLNTPSRAHEQRLFLQQKRERSPSVGSKSKNGASDSDSVIVVRTEIKNRVGNAPRAVIKPKSRVSNLISRREVKSGPSNPAAKEDVYSLLFEEEDASADDGFPDSDTGVQQQLQRERTAGGEIEMQSVSDESDSSVRPRKVQGRKRGPGRPRVQIIEDETSSDDIEEEDGDDILESAEAGAPATPTESTYGRKSSIDITPRRSMISNHLLDDNRQELDIEDETMREEIVKEVQHRHAEMEAMRNFDIIVTIPTFEEVSEHVYNPDEWGAESIVARWTAENGHASYSLLYKDGHTREVDADEILNHVSMDMLEEFENDLFAREENPETYYYPNLKPPGGSFAGGTGFTSGTEKRRGRRSQRKMYLDEAFRLGMPEEFNIPLTDSSDLESDDSEDDDVESEDDTVLRSGGKKKIAPEQYDKFEITDMEILATIRDNESDDESWGEKKKSGRGRGRGRGSRGSRGATIPTRGMRTSPKPRGRGRPKLTPTRGDAAHLPVPTRGRGNNAVKASKTSRGRGRPRGPSTPSRMNISSSDADGSSRSLSPDEIIVIKSPSHAAVRGRPRGSKGVPKLIVPHLTHAAPPGGTSHAQESRKDIRPNTAPNSKPRDGSILKPSRTSLMPRTPTGARGPGRPPKKSEEIVKDDEELIAETIGTGGGNIPLQGRSMVLSRGNISSERPQKRRRIKFGREGVEEVVVDSPRTLASPVRAQKQLQLSPMKRKLQLQYEQHQKSLLKSSSLSSSAPKPSPSSTTPRPPSSPSSSSHRLEVINVIHKTFLEGSPAYHVNLRDHKESIWLRLEDLKSPASRQKIKDFEQRIKEREMADRQVYDSINAQLQLERDKARVAEREARILGKKKIVKRETPAEGVEDDKEEIDDDEITQRRKDVQKERERAARRLAMQERLFIGT